jgi:hypothetical protein
MAVCGSFGFGPQIDSRLVHDIPGISGRANDSLGVLSDAEAPVEPPADIDFAAIIEIMVVPNTIRVRQPHPCATRHAAAIACRRAVRYDVGGCDRIPYPDWGSACWPRAHCTRDRRQEQMGRQPRGSPLPTM